MDAETVFRMGNRHGPGCGRPPHIDIDGSDGGCYYGYFENAYGEQAIFVYDRRTRIGTLWMGDNGWENPAPVVRGRRGAQ